MSGCSSSSTATSRPIAVRRSILTAPERAHQRTPERLASLLEAGNRALGVMEQRLSGADWLAGDRYSVADIALYAYTHDAGAGRLRPRRLSRQSRLGSGAWRRSRGMCRSSGGPPLRDLDISGDVISNRMCFGSSSTLQ